MSFDNIKGATGYQWHTNTFVFSYKTAYTDNFPFPLGI